MSAQKEVTPEKELQIKLVKNLLDVIILQFLRTQPMYGYEMIAKIRKVFNVYFSPSIVYPLLSSLETKAYISSSWDMENDRPRKVYCLTTEGSNALTISEHFLTQLNSKTHNTHTTTSETDQTKHDKSQTTTKKNVEP
ncbi:MAG: PadR family transcriptional regulator [Nitrososphaerota archaeon]|jgi:DNA-binding PadR family transcriptional regulator|nr:PadR family transcriptional regulator [Nitrososphaerota archaeon]